MHHNQWQNISACFVWQKRHVQDESCNPCEVHRNRPLIGSSLPQQVHDQEWQNHKRKVADHVLILHKTRPFR